MESEELLNLPSGIFDSKHLASLIDSKSVYKEINKLIDKGAITRIGRGQYVATGGKREYEYKPSEDLLKIQSIILNQFPELDFRIGEAFQLNWFANHQIAQNIVIVEKEM